MTQQILFLTLKTFSATGGIEKVCRIAGKALSELGIKKDFSLAVRSLHDKTSDVDEKYISKNIFKGYAGNKIKFIVNSIKKGKKSNVVILSHVNLLAVGYAIKKVSAQTTVILLAHGIEVWNDLSTWKRNMLSSCDAIWAVSHYTKEKMIELYSVPEEKLQVLNNCIDPFLKRASDENASNSLRAKYGIQSSGKVLVTLSRLSFKEKYKGYDSVINVVARLKSEHPNIKYLLIGKYDNEEKNRLENLIASQGVKDVVIFAGFVPDEELATHFSISDVYIMPSIKEGFGIAFIEALYYGKPVIAGNRDGSVDALANGKFGLLIDPLKEEEIRGAIQKVFASTESFKPNSSEVEEHFGYDVYKRGLQRLLSPYLNKVSVLSPVLN